MNHRNQVDQASHSMDHMSPLTARPAYLDYINLCYFNTTLESEDGGFIG